ncbi:unnamed protein product [Caenorhabditis auriculariae]|uniref:Uncharacterized protein n=1 Tax=Caenorhabditis auriculariae TaxID=2777116 RepID=A0A8S1HIG3_9PELO|nr:unnamed protein product [Caenorhabditis auriculariae]
MLGSTKFFGLTGPEAMVYNHFVVNSILAGFFFGFQSVVFCLLFFVFFFESLVVYANWGFMIFSYIICEMIGVLFLIHHALFEVLKPLVFKTARSEETMEKEYLTMAACFYILLISASIHRFFTLLELFERKDGDFCDNQPHIALKMTPRVKLFGFPFFEFMIYAHDLLSLILAYGFFCFLETDAFILAFFSCFEALTVLSKNFLMIFFCLLFDIFLVIDELYDFLIVLLFYSTLLVVSVNRFSLFLEFSHREFCNDDSCGYCGGEESEVGSPEDRRRSVMDDIC